MGTCGTFTYTLIQQDGASATSSIFSSVTSLSFTIDTSTIYTTTSYLLKIVGAVTAGTSNFAPFTVTITSCSSSTVALTSNLATQYYIILDPVLQLTMPGIQITNPTCSIVTGPSYTVTYTGTGS